MSATLETLCALADEIGGAHTAKRRPSWAPYILPAHKNSARLWALFTKQAPFRCEGFHLRLGAERSGECIFYSYKPHGHWVSGPQFPRGVYALEDAHSAKRQHVTELAGRIVTAFADRPDEQLVINGRLTERCGIRNLQLRDPLSLERGVGADCFRHLEHIREMFRAARRRAHELAAGQGEY